MKAFFRYPLFEKQVLGLYISIKMAAKYTNRKITLNSDLVKYKFHQSINFHQFFFLYIRANFTLAQIISIPFPLYHILLVDWLAVNLHVCFYKYQY